MQWQLLKGKLGDISQTRGVFGGTDGGEGWLFDSDRK